MGRQRGLKQQRRNNERIEAESEIFPIIEFMLNEYMNLDQPEDFMDAVLKRLMLMLPSFSSKNFELWAIKIEGLLGSVDLWKFVQETDMNFENKSRRAIALFLIISALDENILSSILNEFGEVFDPKMFWHILEMKYSIKWIQKDEIDEIVVKNSDCDESIIKTENMLVAEKIVACDSEGTPSHAKICEVKYETCEVKYDEYYVSHEEWFNFMHEKQLIDELLFGEMTCLSSDVNQMQDDMFATKEMIKEVENMNQPNMKNEYLHNDVEIVERKIMEDSIEAQEAVEDSIATNVVENLIIVDELKKVNRPFKEECADIDSEEKAIKLEEMASINDKCKSRKPRAMVNGKNVSMQLRKGKLHHYLMARKVKMKLHLKINKYGPFRKKTKMKVLFSCIVVSLAET